MQPFGSVGACCFLHLLLLSSLNSKAPDGWWGVHAMSSEFGALVRGGSWCGFKVGVVGVGRTASCLDMLESCALIRLSDLAKYLSMADILSSGSLKA